MVFSFDLSGENLNYDQSGGHVCAANLTKSSILSFFGATAGKPARGGFKKRCCCSTTENMTAYSIC